MFGLCGYQGTAGFDLFAFANGARFVEALQAVRLW